MSKLFMEKSLNLTTAKNKKIKENHKKRFLKKLNKYKLKMIIMKRTVSVRYRPIDRLAERLAFCIGCSLSQRQTFQ